jgi:hypothetical protein
MGQALTDDRAASSASAAAHLCDTQWGTPPTDMRHDPYWDTPWPYFANGPQGTGLPPALVTSPGYPIYVDPWGVANGSGPLGASNQTTPATPGIPRVAPTVVPPPYSVVNAGPPPAYLPNAARIAPRYFSLPDDMTFAPNGLPDLSTGSVQRGGRYTWGLLLHRLHPSDPASPVDLTVVVYAGRKTAVPGGENTYAVLPDPKGVANVPNSTSVMIQYAGQQPNIRRRGWILDSSYNATNGSVNGLFYRVAAVTQPANGVLQLEVETPLARPVTAVTVMDNVADVFERGTAPSNQWEFRNDVP